MRIKAANLENSAVATGLEKVTFHSNPKERQCQRMFKLSHNCTHLTCQQSRAQNSSRQASIALQLRTSRCSSWIQKRQRNQKSNCQYLLDHRKKEENSRETSTSASLIMLKSLTVRITTNWKILQEVEIPDHLTLSRPLLLLPSIFSSISIRISQEAGKVVWYSHLLKNFPQFVVTHTVKGIGIVNKADVFLELSCFFDDPANVGILISGSSAFSKSSLNIWRFTVHVLSKPGLEKFEHDSLMLPGPYFVCQFVPRIPVNSSVLLLLTIPQHDCYCPPSTESCGHNIICFIIALYLDIQDHLCVWLKKHIFFAHIFLRINSQEGD